jgi:phosphatidylglycerol:prolipoprotein diacylglycerol transferase
MHPILFDLGPFALHTYGLFMALGFLLAMQWSVRETRLAGLDSELVPELTISIVIGAVVGARLLHVLMRLPYYADHPLEALMFWHGGMVFSGGLAMGFAVGLWEARRRRQNFLQWLDCVVPGIVLGQAVGRVGCFMAGCCYGRPSDLPWACTFTDPASLAEPLGVALHPTQLYHAGANLLIFLVLVGARGRLGATGRRTGLYLVLFAVARFIIEFYRADFRGTLGPFSVTHATTAAFGLAGMWLLFRNRHRSA